MKKILPLLWGLSLAIPSMAQSTFSVNGVADHRSGVYAFLHATIHRDAKTVLNDATLLIRDGKVESVGNSLAIPSDAVVVDCAGKHLYPSFIDVFADYGMPPQAQRSFAGGFDFRNIQLNSSQKGAYGWNQSIRPEVEASKLFAADEAKAKGLRDIGFGTVLTHLKDGIARGTGAVVTLGSRKENLEMLKPRASAHYSFNKGSSMQSYPSSMMGSISLLRQSYLDAGWYRNNNKGEGINLTLQAWNAIQDLPQVFDAGEKWNVLRADRIGDEFGVQYIIKGGGNEYQRIAAIAATKASFILPLNFPATMDVEDPNDARFVSLADMKHWELAPTNPAAFERAGIPFALTTAELRDVKGFAAAIRKAIEYGLSETAALDALTLAPARMLGLQEMVGSLEPGKLANLIVTSGPVFSEQTQILQNWVQGVKYGVKEDAWKEIKGTYALTLTTDKGQTVYVLDVKGSAAASILGKDTLMAKFSHDGKLVRISFSPEKRARGQYRLSGVSQGAEWYGYGEDSSGLALTWSAALQSTATPKADSARRRPSPRMGAITYPFLPFGWTQQPAAQDLLIRNATVWTSESQGRLEQTDILVKRGKIVQIGKGLADPTARVIDATGKHVTAGLIDEHSHIAASSINEGGQSVTSEVRIADNLNPDDINIYRQLSGGVTTSHILHGSANTIGGQTQLIKLRWGADDEGLKFKGAPGFIKFALGENVKRSSLSQGNTRFPDTRMGVEQVLTDAFHRAKAYEQELRRVAAEQKSRKAAVVDPYREVRRDLELEALVEILNRQRFITCHSYVQSEINAAMKVGERLGFTFNTFTHILEGYKVADKMKAHGANASTFSDWWAYKNEVEHAIPQNPTIMHKVGLNVAINSDDAEMARRLNQEAAKSVKYGGMSETDALNMVTINPARMLHVEDKVGSIRVGKDADLVIWSDHPLSIYARAEKTLVDGVVYFDREQDAAMRRQVAAERNRLMGRMGAEKRGGGPVVPAMPSYQYLYHCSDHLHSHGLLTIDID
ncbi:MAG: amidohydrolase family protein [Bacteroidetes bacterium]|nr:amidohydrolase family protein [Bacteroidota bacterium]